VRTVNYTTYRQVWQEYQVPYHYCTYTPIYQQHVREHRYTVHRPVYQDYQVPVKTVTCKPVYEQHVREVPVTCCRAVTETHQKLVKSYTCEPIWTERQIKVCTGDWCVEKHYCPAPSSRRRAGCRVAVSSIPALASAGTALVRS
jgi:hypothetical protein